MDSNGQDDAAAHAGDEPEDVEALAHESAAAMQIRRAFLYCSLLGFSLYALLGLDDADNKDFVVTLAPGQYVHMLRTTAQLSLTGLDQEIGHDAGFIESVEAGEIDLVEYPVQLALDIARSTRSPACRLLKVLEQAAKRS
ncbi:MULTISPECIES: hypothetical protein [unclassified Variovorax]|uniref:hypothetical protein n=1 Tax=unclassified Variovorax TaxID=663243 RepID=UPI00076CBE54|nr:MULTISPECIES: hypothetical protein [unclassified Variovorax]KWT73899.1 hypothetical protein APY03_5750 [Variovorax sp. WDL1]